MVCFEIDLKNLLYVTMLNKTDLVPPQKHCTRYIGEYIMYVIKSGTLSLLQDGRELDLFPGDVYFFNKGEFQTPARLSECEFYYLHFEGDNVKRLEFSDEEYIDYISKRKVAFMKSNIFGAECYEHMKVLIPQRTNIRDKQTLEGIVNIFRNNFVSYGYNAPEWRLNVSVAAAGLLMRLESICFETPEGRKPKGK